jgi:hypothetical protein
MYIFVNWSLHQATCHHQFGCAEGNQPETFNLLVNMTIFFCLVRTRTLHWLSTISTAPSSCTESCTVQVYLGVSTSCTYCRTYCVCTVITVHTQYCMKFLKCASSSPPGVFSFKISHVWIMGGLALTPAISITKKEKMIWRIPTHHVCNDYDIMWRHLLM